MKQQKYFKEEVINLFMATLHIFEKPTGFNLSSSYERINIESNNEYSGNNYSFIVPLENETTGFTKYLIGQYLEMKETGEYPSEEGLIEKDFRYPTRFIFEIYVSQDKIFCIGNNKEIIKDILKRHSQIEEFNVEIIDLDKIELGFNRGLIGISGQRYKTEQGTLVKMVRKADPVSFECDESSFECGDDIDREYLEVLVSIEDVTRRFKIYLNGKITYQGRFELGQNKFLVLKRVYNKVNEIIDSAENE
ncbi:MAG: hypothetical protein ABFQ65_02950 [Nanoarchaeota archaeon]